MLTFEFDSDDLEIGDKEKADLLIRSFMHDLADFVEDLFVQKVPYASGRTLHAVRQGRVNKLPGGNYTVEVGVGPIFGLKYGESPEYPLFVHEGTGIYATGNEDGLVQPLHGNVMAFEKLGEGTVFTRWVEGQPAQPYLDEIEGETKVYIELKKAELAAAINGLT